MIKKMLIATAVIGGAMLVAVAPASAGDHDRSGPGISILDNACVAPWHWEGPGNIATTGQTTYAACNDNSTANGAGISIADNACVAPWHWEGPLNILTGGDTSYVVCNGNSAG